MSEKQLNLRKKIPISHRNEFWNSLIQSVEDEILTLVREMEKKRTLLSYRESSLDNLLDLLAAFVIFPRENFEIIRTMLNKAYGLSDEIIEFYMRKELYKIPFNHKEKGTLHFYNTIFSTFGFSFDHQISIYRHIVGTNTIIRDIEPLLDGVGESVFEYGFADDEEDVLTDDYFSLGFVGVVPALCRQQSKNNFSGYISEPQILDHGEFVPDISGEYRFSEELGSFIFDPDLGTHSWSGLKLDEGLIFNTITRSVVTSTKHLGLEVELNRSMYKNYQPCLLPYEAFQYIFASAYFYRRQVEVPHVGGQLTIILDKSGFWDTHSDEVITQNIVPISKFEQDYVWVKGTGWRIENGTASFIAGPIVPPPPTPQQFPLLQTAFVLPEMTLENLEKQEFGEIPQGTQMRISITVDELMLYPPDPNTPPLYVFTVDHSFNLKRVLFQIRIPGTYEKDFIWMEDELSVLNIGSLTPVVISEVEAIPFERFSIPDIRARGAMREGVVEEGIIGIDYLQFGMGEQRLPSRLDGDYEFPTELEAPLAIVFPIDEGANTEKFQSDEYIGVIAQYVGQLVNGIPIPRTDQLDGTSPIPLGMFDLPPTGSSSFDGVLPSILLPIRRGTLILGIVNMSDPFNNPIPIMDNGKGDLVSALPGLSGTINYTTGMIHLDFPTPFYAPQGVILQQVYINSPTFVTEVGVWGRTASDPLTPQLLAYMTFAPVELMSNAFHLNMGVILER